MSRRFVQALAGLLAVMALAGADGFAVNASPSGISFLAPSSSATDENPDQVLEWNQIFIETLIATNTPNSSSQRLGAIVHTAIFDAYNGIERRYTPVFVNILAPRGASRRAAVIAAAYTALVGLFPSQKPALDSNYAASLAALSDDGEDGGESRERGIAWGTDVAQAVLSWRATDGFNASYPPFTGGNAVGQWRPTPPAFGPMSNQALAFTAMFVLASNTQFRPEPPRSLASATYTDDFNMVKALGRKTGSPRTEDQTELAFFWNGNASVHWNQAANQIARANHLSMSDSNRLLAVLNIAMADMGCGERARDLNSHIEGLPEFQSSARHPLAQSHSVDELHGNKMNVAAVVSDFVNGDYVRVIQRRSGARLLLEAMQSIPVPGELGRE
jgi:hypothetical protein